MSIVREFENDPAVECAVCGQRMPAALILEHMDGHGYRGLFAEIANAEIVDLTGEPE